jgi:hypothetical protein
LTNTIIIFAIGEEENLTRVDEYLVEEKQCGKDYCKLIFKADILFDYKEVVKVVLDPDFGKSVSGKATLQNFTVTSGGYDTIDGGFQYTVAYALGLSEWKRVEHVGNDINSLNLGSDEFVSRLFFVFATPKREYSMQFYANCLEIKPRPTEAIVKMCISKLKQSLASSANVFLNSAKIKFQCGILDFLGQRYRAVPHNVYYALHELIKCFSIWSHLNPEFQHGAKAQARLTEILTQISLGKHRQFIESSIWKESEATLRKIDVKRYETLTNDLYEMRGKADYEIDFEMGEYLPELSNLMLKVEELFTLAMYMEEGCIALSGEQMIPIFHYARQLEPIGETSTSDNIGLDMLKEGKHYYYNILQKGLILAENFDYRVFLTELLKRKEIYFTPFRPPLSRRDHFVKIEKKGDHWTFSDTFSEEIAQERGYMPYTIENVKKISEQTKSGELASIQKNPIERSRGISFCYGISFFELVVYSDGRFYLLSPIVLDNVNPQIEWSIRLRAVIAKIVNSNWEHKSTISFSGISIAP